jgi:hypothetical protein
LIGCTSPTSINLNIDCKREIFNTLACDTNVKNNHFDFNQT